MQVSRTLAVWTAKKKKFIVVSRRKSVLRNVKVVRQVCRWSTANGAMLTSNFSNRSNLKKIKQKKKKTFLKLCANYRHCNQDNERAPYTNHNYALSKRNLSTTSFIQRVIADCVHLAVEARSR